MAATTAKTFEYAVRDRGGKIVKGRIEAPNQAAVANRLKTMGLAPMSINEVGTGGLSKEISIPGFSDKISLKDLAIMARQLATMINAGLSLLRSLTILAEQTESKPLAKRIAQVRNDVEVGVAFSDGSDQARGRLPAADDQHGQGRRGRRLPRPGARLGGARTSRTRSSCAARSSRR